MKIGILGSGVVGQTIGAKLVERGEDVVLGTRSPTQLANERGRAASLGEWLEKTNNKARVATFQEAARHGEIVINATSGADSLEALTLAGEANLAKKILIDVANPLDFSRGMPPSLLVCNTDSLGRANPARVPGGEGREDAEHDERNGHGGPRPGRRWRP